MKQIIRTIVLVAVMVIFAAAVAHAQGNSDELRWVKPKAGASLARLKKTIEGRGGRVLTLAPEGRLLVRYPSRAATKLSAVSGVESSDAFTQVAEPSKPEPVNHGLGLRIPTPEEAAQYESTQVTSVEANELGIARAALDPSPSPQLQSLPSAVDNSVSMYFPPIRTQGQQGSCAAWATTYYYQTFLQAQDEGLNAASGNNNYICSPAFTYNLQNGGVDDGSSLMDDLDRLYRSGAPSWSQMPYDENDYLTWPSEAAWIDAIKRRTNSQSQIGTGVGALTDTDMLALKQHLANGNIAVTQTKVFDNMYYVYPADTVGVNNGVLFANGNTYIDGHALTVVGYDDNKSYFDGSTTRYGAVLIANSWGTNWGTYNSIGTSRGFMWVGYDYFKGGNIGGYWIYGVARYTTDRDNYRSRLYAVAGVNHSSRGRVMLRGGIGPASAPAWLSEINTLHYNGGLTVAVNDGRRIAVDLNDGIPCIAWPNVRPLVQMGVSSLASSNGTLTNTTFYYDFDGDGAYDTISASNTPVTVAPDQMGDAEASFTYSDGTLDHFNWSPIGSTQTAYAPFAATITARDNVDRIVTGFSGTPTISACIETTSSIGTGTGTSYVPLSTYDAEGRSQSIYLQSELGAATTLKGIMLDVTTVPPVILQNFTIRLKHTSLTSFPAGSSWQTDFITVYRHNRSITSTGWTLIEFDTPFDYNGADNLMIDFSFFNPTYANSDGFVHISGTGVSRTTYGGGDIYGDPLNWTGTSNPTLTYSTNVPNIKLISSHAVAITPTSTGSFSGGSWTGSLTITEPASGVILRVDDGAGHSGRSNAFTVQAGVPPGSLTVTLGPLGAVSAGAQWRRAGQSAWRASGATETGIVPGYYTLEFLQIPGWNCPSPQSVTVNSGATASTSAQYEQMSLVYVDFAFGGTQFGTESSPYNLLGTAVSAVTSGGTVRLAPGTSGETPRITKPIRVEAPSGTATIGR